MRLSQKGLDRLVGSSGRSMVARAGTVLPIFVIAVILAAWYHSPRGRIRAASRDVFPVGCPDCMSTKRLAWGPFSLLAHNIVSHPLPPVPQAMSGSPPREPWIFELTVNLGGNACAVKLLRGADGPFTDSLVVALRAWKFKPFHLRTGATCYQARVFFYLRQRSDRTVIEVPGLE